MIIVSEASNYTDKEYGAVGYTVQAVGYTVQAVGYTVQAEDYVQ